MRVINDSYVGQVASLEIHTPGPSAYDSFYYYNPTEQYYRTFDFYDISYVPTFRFEGKYIADPGDDVGGVPVFPTVHDWCNFYRRTVDSLLAIPSPIQINLWQHWSADSDSVYVSFDVVCVDSVTGTLSLYLAVSEWGHKYAFPVPTLPKRWYHAFRDMLPDQDGEPISLSIGDSLHFDWIYPIADVFFQDDNILVDDKMDIITTVWIQKGVTKKVVQAYSERVSDVAGIDPGKIPVAISGGGNAPNPFSSETSISYSLSRPGGVNLSVYSLTGQLVTTLVDGPAEPGGHVATWDGTDRFGDRVASGVYYYRLEAEGQAQAGKMIFVR